MEKTLTTCLLALLAALSLDAGAATSPAPPSASGGGRDGAMPAPAPTGHYAKLDLPRDAQALRVD
jgi:hypothetical protein